MDAKKLAKAIAGFGDELVLSEFSFVHSPFDDDEALELLKTLAFDKAIEIHEELVTKIPLAEIVESSARAVRVWRALSTAASRTVPFAETLARLDGLLNGAPALNALDIVGLYALARASAKFEASFFEARSNIKRATKAAEGKHGQRGGNWEKKSLLLEIWKSGKYKTKDQCADREFEALGVARDTAREWLKGVAAPRSRSARKAAEGSGC